jgi:hypothetical protein
MDTSYQHPYLSWKHSQYLSQNHGINMCRLYVYLISNMNIWCICVGRVIQSWLGPSRQGGSRVHPPPCAHGPWPSQLTRPTPWPTVSPHKTPIALAKTKLARNHLLLCRLPSQTKPTLPLGLTAGRSTPSSLAVVFH